MLLINVSIPNLIDA